MTTRIERARDAQRPGGRGSAWLESQRACIYRWAYGMCRRHEDALDVVQDVLVRVATTAAAVPEDAGLTAWLRRVTAGAVIDRWRSERTRAVARVVAGARAVGGDSRGDASEPGMRLESEEQVAVLRETLLSLSEQQRLVVLAKFYEGLTFERVAAELGISVPTAKTHYLRALAALRDRLKVDLSGSVR